VTPFHVYFRSGLSWAASQLADRFAHRPIAHFEAIREAAWDGRWADAAILVSAVGVLSDRGEDTLTLDRRLKDELGFDWEAIHQEKAALDAEVAALEGPGAARSVESSREPGRVPYHEPAVTNEPPMTEQPPADVSQAAAADGGWD
jgi:hypothetical protein